MFTDLVLNSVNPGEVGFDFINPGTRFDTGLLRPYIDMDTREKMVTINTGRSTFDKKSNSFVPVYEEISLNELTAQGVNSPVANAASLRKDEWIALDNVVIRAARQRLRAYADLAAANTYGLNGMARTVLEHETMSDPGEAQVDMDGLTEGRTDAPRFQLEALPLPITHSDFWFSSRKLAISRNSGTPLDTVMAEAAGRRVAEAIEKTLIGVQTGLAFGTDSRYGRTSQVYGYTNFPDRVTYTSVTAPSSGGWKPSDTIANVLAMRELLYDQNMYGPFMLYHSADWDQYLDGDYYALATSGMTAPNQTLRQRLSAIEGIQGVRRLDFFSTAFSLVLVQMTADVARAVNGMDITTVQWESQGGMRLNFKVMAIQVPQLRADYNGNCGVCHGTTA